MKTRIEYIIDIINRNPNVVERCEYIGFTKELIQEIQRLQNKIDRLLKAVFSVILNCENYHYVKDNHPCKV